jgi:hypothetical protein
LDFVAFIDPAPYQYSFSIVQLILRIDIQKLEEGRSANAANKINRLRCGCEERAIASAKYARSDGYKQDNVESNDAYNGPSYSNAAKWVSEPNPEEGVYGDNLPVCSSQCQRKYCPLTMVIIAEPVSPNT